MNLEAKNTSLLTIKPYCRYPDGGVGQPGSAAERSGRAVARRAGAQQGRARQPGDGDEGVPQEAAGQCSTELQMNLREYLGGWRIRIYSNHTVVAAGGGEAHQAVQPVSAPQAAAGWRGGGGAGDHVDAGHSAGRQEAGPGRIQGRQSGAADQGGGQGGSLVSIITCPLAILLYLPLYGWFQNQTSGHHHIDQFGVNRLFSSKKCVK